MLCADPLHQTPNRELVRDSGHLDVSPPAGRCFLPRPPTPKTTSTGLSPPRGERHRTESVSPRMERKPAGGDPTATSEGEVASESLFPPLFRPCPDDVRLCGHLRKQKSQRLRFFVLRANPPCLECYQSEKKFRAGGGRPARPRRRVSLAGACTISKRADARQRHLIVLYTPDSSLGVAAASEEEQQAWYSALLEVRAAAAVAGPRSLEGPKTWVLTPFQDVWPVTLRPKGLGRTRSLGSGSYRLCLGSGTLSLLRKPRGRGSQDGPAAPPPTLRLSLLSVRRCGCADSLFFLELGRSAPTGPGELWLQAPDAVVAKSIHETVLAAIKRLGGGGLRDRAESLPRHSLMSASRVPVPQPYETPASVTQTGVLGEKTEQAIIKTFASLQVAASEPRELDLDGDYITMGARGARNDNKNMAVRQASDYELMASPGLHPARAPPHQPPQDLGVTEYVSMKSFSPPLLPYKPEARTPGARHLGDVWEGARAEPSTPQPSERARDCMYIQYEAVDSMGVCTVRHELPNNCSNYVDLDLVPLLRAHGHAPGAAHTATPKF